MEQNRIYYLIAKKLAGEATRKELAELDKLLKEHPEPGYTQDILSNLWKQETAEHGYEAGKAYERLLQKLEDNNVTLSPQPAKLPAKKFHLPKIDLLFPREFTMLRNYFTIAWRNLVRGKAFSFIKVSGLAIGMASAILILLWIHNELTFDSFHKKGDRIYAAYSLDKFEGKLEVWNGSPMLLAPVLELNYPEVERTARINKVYAFIFHAGDKHIGSYGLLTDPGFLQIFDYPLLKGDAATALNTPRSLVVTEKFAKKLFGDADAMGKMVRIDSSSNFMVTGILKDLPNNTAFDFEYLAPWSYMKEVHWDRPNWELTDIQTIVLLKPGISEAIANARMANVIKLHSKEANTSVFLHPLSKWRLWSKFENGKVAGGYIETVRLFGVIAAFILLIACINYMNLSTAKSVKRAREVGIRKVVGAGKGSLVVQFIGESLVVAMIAGLLALGVAELSLDWFNGITGKELLIPYANPYFWLGAAVFVVFTGILAGSYPAFYLSAYRPIQVLKGTFKAVYALVTPRKVLVVFQFSFAIALIICTIVVYQQIKYGQSRDIGYNQNNLAFVFLKGDMQKKYALITRELLGSGAITSVTRTNSPITDVWNGVHGYEWQGKDPNQTYQQFALFHTDKDFVRTMGMKLVSGRDIDAEKYPTDSSALILNESAIKMMKLKDPIGQTIKSPEGQWQVVGVVKDFIPGTPFASSFPIAVQGPGKHHWYGTMTVKLNPANPIGENIKAIGDILKKHNPDYPYEYFFADDTYASKFTQEKRTATLALVFASLTIFISCLGLFALAAYMAENRTKEIGIRKVLGASVLSISTLLSKDFLKLILISLLVASPVAWWAMHNWLDNYAYRISINIWIFIFTGFISILIAVITVSFQAIRAALASPTKSLRTE